MSRIDAIAKRGLDLGLILLAAPLLLPIVLLVAAIVRLRLGSPVLFQTRPGLGGKPFRLAVRESRIG